MAQIAGELGCEIRTVSNLIKRLFPRIMGVILGHLFRWKHSKSSCLATPDIEVIDRKEPLLCFHVEGVQVGERPAERVQVDEIDRLGPQIGNILRECGPLNRSERQEFGTSPARAQIDASGGAGY